MRIEVVDQQDGLSGEPEVWVQVQSNDCATDWPSVQAKLTPEQREALGITPGAMARRPCAFEVDRRTDEERQQSEFRYEDTWIFRKVTA